MIRVLGYVLAFLVAAGGDAADYAQAGALARDGNWEVSVVFDPTVNRASALSSDAYIKPEGSTLLDVRDQPLGNAVILTLSGLTTNSTYSMTLTNLTSTTGAPLAPLALSFTATPNSWVAIGAQELGFPADAIAIGTNGFDLISGGAEMWSSYDESTFAFETVTGDFDRRARVISQENSSHEARAGLMIREALDERKPRPIDNTNPEEAFSRYIQVHVNPVMTAYTDFDGSPVAARNEHQVNIRSLPGGSTENPVVETNAPAYPNAWLRVKRSGQTFHVFRGTDGTNWVRLGTFTFPTTDLDGNPVPAFSERAYVGPNYSPENANIPDASGERSAFIARFRDYSPAFGEVDLDPPQLSIARSGADVEITWSSGTLQSSTNLLGGGWTDLSTAGTVKLTPDKPHQFFRARNP